MKNENKKPIIMFLLIICAAIGFGHLWLELFGDSKWSKAIFGWAAILFFVFALDGLE